MKVLLVKPILEKHRTWHYSPPLGLGYLATAIRKEHDVEILDSINEDMTFERFERLIKEKKPDVVGFMFFTCETDSVVRSLQIIKNVKPDTVTVVGGPHPSCMPQETLERIPEIDYVFVSEGEIGLPLFLDILLNPAAIL